MWRHLFTRITQAALSPEDFKAKALPLHVNITQTPPNLDESKDEQAAASTSDAGFIASIAMQPSAFSTGSYGWKGSRRITIPYVLLAVYMFQTRSQIPTTGWLEAPMGKP